MRVQILIHRDAEDLASAAADRIAAAINDEPGRKFSLGLAGGSTPILTYRELREQQVAWSKVDAWMSDERWVPMDHPECNGHQAAQELMDHVHARFHRPVWKERLHPAESAADFEEVLRSLHPEGRADLILLGMGDDGHTASLFPGTDALDAPPGRWFIENEVPQLDTVRLTTTLPFLRAARNVFFLVAGEGKAEALRQVLEPADGEEVLPAAMVDGGDAEVTWLVDEAAASRLTLARTR